MIALDCFVKGRKNSKAMFGWPDIAWDRIRDEIFYPIPCLVGDGIG